jgi:hypothetical protein
MKTRIAVLSLFTGLLLAAATQAQASCRIDVITASVRRVVNTDDRIVTAIYRTRTGAGMRQVNCPDQSKPSVRLWSEDRQEWVWFDEKIDRDGFVFRKNGLEPGVYKIVLWTKQFNGRNEAGHRLTRYITGERRFRAN